MKYKIDVSVSPFFNYSQTVNSSDLKLTEYCLKNNFQVNAIFTFNFNSINLVNI